MLKCAVFVVQSVGMSTVRKIVRKNTDVTVERSLTQNLIHGSYHTHVAKSVADRWGQIVAIHAIFFVIQVNWCDDNW